MEDLIVVQNKSIFKKITAILIALWTIHPFYTLYFNWFIYFKITLILGLLGIGRRYKFANPKIANEEIVFLKWVLFNRSIIKKEIDYVSVYKSTESVFYNIQLFSGKDYKTILSSKDYNEIVSVSSQISHLLEIDFFNPFEDYEQY